MGKSTAFSSGFLAGEEDATGVAVGAVAEGGGGGQVCRAEAVKRGGGAVGPGAAVGAGKEEIVGGGEEVLPTDHRQARLVDREIRHIGAFGAMGPYIAGGVAKFMGHQHPQGAVTVVGNANPIGDAIEAIAVVAKLSRINHLAEHRTTLRSHHERLGGKGGFAHLAGESERQGVGGTAQIHLVHTLEAVQQPAAVALHHQEHAAAGVIGDIADLVLAGAAAEQVQMLLHRSPRGRIDGQDAGELRRAALGGNTIGIAVDIQRALHEGVEQAVLAVEGHAFDAAVGPAVAVDGRQTVDRFGADHTAVLSLKQGFLAGGDIALDQIAGAEIKQADLAAVFIAHRKHLAAHAADAGGEDGDGFRIDAKGVVGKVQVGGIHRDLIFALQLRQACERRAIRTLQTDDGKLAHRARGTVHAELVDGGLKIRV